MDNVAAVRLNEHRYGTVRNSALLDIIVLCFGGVLAFDFCRFCVVIRFFHSRHNGQ